MNKVKVIVTIGPASKDIEVIKELIINGADVIRLDLGVSPYEFCEDIIEKVDIINNQLKTNVGIMLDTKGTSIKTGHFLGGHANFTTGDKIRIYMGDLAGDNTKFSVDYPNLLNEVKFNTHIKLNNGDVDLLVLDKGSDYLICEVINGGNLTDYSNVIVPGIKNDKMDNSNDIDFANKMNVDYIALSYVRTEEDVLDATDKLIGYGNDHIEVISKIECEDAIDNIDEIIKSSNGVMIARNSLGNEIPMERIPALQKIIIKKCHRMGKVSTVASEMMVLDDESGKPSRAEVSDVVNAVLDGTDSIMLCGESTTNKYPIKTIQAMESIIKEAEHDIDYYQLAEEAFRTEDMETTGIIAYSVAEAANKLKCKAIIAPTISGYTARKISRFRPCCPIIAVSPDVETVKALNMYFGVTAVLIDELNSLDKIISKAKKITDSLIELEEGDKIVVTGGYPFKESKHTNFMKIEEI